MSIRDEIVISNVRNEFISFNIWLDGRDYPYFLFVWRDKDERDENYYLIIFQIIINNTLINIC
jgi:hypothetical protein